MMFSNPHITIAHLGDVTTLKNLLNSAYRGEASQKGWTTEAHLIAGEVRTDDASVIEVINKEGSVMLKFTDDAGNIVGCVNLQKHGSRVYLGMFSVSPGLQGGGIGKQLLHASEGYARHVGCSSIYMTVISARTELIDWYKRYGYADTGERKPFEEDGLTGTHLQKLEFMVLEKQLNS